MASKTTAKKSTKGTRTTKKTIASKPSVSKATTTRKRKTSSTSRTPMMTVPLSGTKRANSGRSFFPSMKLRRSSIITGIVVLVVIVLLLVLSRYLVVATVNGVPITRAAYYRQLEQLDSKQALNNLVINQLILQKAAKDHVTVSQNEINAEIKSVEASVKQQGQTLDQALKDRHMTRKDLEENIRIQKLAEKMIGKDITVSDKEIQDYIDKNKDALPQNENQATLKKTVSDTIRNQKMSEKSQAWVAALQKNAKIKYLD